VTSYFFSYSRKWGYLSERELLLLAGDDTAGMPSGRPAGVPTGPLNACARGTRGRRGFPAAAGRGQPARVRRVRPDVRERAELAGRQGQAQQPPGRPQPQESNTGKNFFTFI